MTTVDPLFLAFGDVVNVCSLREAQVVARVREAWRVGHGGAIFTANVDTIRAAVRDPSLAELMANASLVVADGMPLLWAAWLMGNAAGAGHWVVAGVLAQRGRGG